MHLSIIVIFVLFSAAVSAVAGQAPDFVNTMNVVPRPSSLASSVTPKPTEVQCAKDSDCAEVSSSCDGCCQRVAINKLRLDDYGRRVDSCQRQWMKQKNPIVCDCSPAEAVAKCIDKKCALAVKGPNNGFNPGVPQFPNQ